MSLAAGSRLGPYEIVSPIGAGGMGEVYRAKDTRLDRSVAIKVLPAHVSGDPDTRARFAREAKAIAGLSHPHICTLYDVGEHDGATFLVMEHLTGETLAQRLEKGSLPLEQALAVATEIAEALCAAHRQGVIHRDLKPGNVMLTETGAKLLDFGLAKLKPHGGEPPNPSLTSAPTQSAPLMTRQPITPPALERLVGRCLAKDPGSRWDTAHDVAEELRWIARPTETISGARVSRPARRRWALAAALTVVALAVGAAALRLSGAWRPSAPRGPSEVERALALDEGLALAHTDPLLKGVEGDRRYAALLARMRLPL